MKTQMGPALQIASTLPFTESMFLLQDYAYRVVHVIAMFYASQPVMKRQKKRLLWENNILLQTWQADQIAMLYP